MNNTSPEKANTSSAANSAVRFTFRKHERLTHRMIIERLFQVGKAYKDYPLILLALPCELGVPTQIVVNVSKRSFKRASDRNRIKRLLREAWRHNKHEVNATAAAAQHQFALAYLYVGKELPHASLIHTKISELNQRLIQDIPKFQSTNLPERPIDHDETQSP